MHASKRPLKYTMLVLEVVRILNSTASVNLFRYLPCQNSGQLRDSLEVIEEDDVLTGERTLSCSLSHKLLRPHISLLEVTLARRDTECADVPVAVEPLLRRK